MSIYTLIRFTCIILHHRNHLKEIEMDDINGVCQECGISTVQKIKLKTAIKTLASQQNLPPVCSSEYIYKPNFVIFMSIDIAFCAFDRL